MITLLNSINKKPHSLFNNAVIRDKKKLCSLTFIPANIKQFLIYFLPSRNGCHFPICSLTWRSFHLLTHFPAAKREAEMVLLNPSNSNGYTDMKWNHSMISTPVCKTDIPVPVQPSPVTESYAFASACTPLLRLPTSNIPQQKVAPGNWQITPLSIHDSRSYPQKWWVVLDIWKSCLVNFCKFILVGHCYAVDT